MANKHFFLLTLGPRKNKNKTFKANVRVNNPLEFKSLQFATVKVSYLYLFYMTPCRSDLIRDYLTKF